MFLVPCLWGSFSTFSGIFLPIFCYAVSSCVYDHSHPYLVSECLFLAENKAFPHPRRLRAHPRRLRAHPRRLRAILWDAAATCSVVIFVVVAEKKRSPKLSVSWLTLYGLVDRLPVSAGNFRRALQRHFLVDFQTEDIARKIFSCSKRAYFALVNRARNGWTAFARSLPRHRFHDWSKTEAALQRQRHCSVICQSIFKTKISLERSLPALNDSCFAFVNRTRNGWTASARSLPTHRFRNWLKTEAALKFNLLTGYPKYETHALHSRHWLGESMKRSAEL